MFSAKQLWRHYQTCSGSYQNASAGRKYLDLILQAVEILCEARTDETGRNIFSKPSLGSKLGHSLLKCARLKKREAIKESNKVTGFDVQIAKHPLASTLALRTLPTKNSMCSQYARTSWL